MNHKVIRERKREEDIRNGVVDLSARIRALVYENVDVNARIRKNVKRSHQKQTQDEFFNGVVPNASVVLERRERFRVSKVKAKQFKNRGKYT